MPRDVTIFLQWCGEQGIAIDSRLGIVAKEDGSWYMWCNEDITDGRGECLVQIPKSSVFSVKSCSYSDVIVASLSSDDAPTLGLAFALLTELSLGPKSPWYGYLQALPVSMVNVALLWAIYDDGDSVEASKWLIGTQVEKVLYPSGQVALLERLDAFYEHILQPTLPKMNIKCSRWDFYRAYSLVSSRAFLVDVYLGLSLVPVADIFNHAEGNHVHLECDYHVCPACGSLAECDHDVEPDDESSARSLCSISDICEMVTNTAIIHGEEVFNTYEKGLTNAQSLAHYGFMLEGNENNIVTWTTEELLSEISDKSQTIVSEWQELLKRWPIGEDWDSSQLVYNQETDNPSVVPAPQVIELTINADGQLSHSFWSLLFILAVNKRHTSISPDTLRMARQISQTQIQIEACTSGDEGNGWNATSTDEDHVGTLKDIAELVIFICEIKINAMHLPGMADSKLGELLDVLPMSHRLTRLAMSYALEERKLVAQQESDGRRYVVPCVSTPPRHGSFLHLVTAKWNLKIHDDVAGGDWILNPNEGSRIRFI